jgi:predicted ferric reductase
MSVPQALSRHRGGIGIAGLCGSAVALWAIAVPLDVRLSSLPIALNTLAVAAALAAAAAFPLSLVLAARLPVVERLFGGLDRVYGAHRATAIGVLVLVLAHGVLLAASRAAISLAAVPSLFALSIDNWRVLLGAVVGVVLSIGMYLTLRGRMRHELFVWVQRALGVAFVGAVVHAFAHEGAKSASLPLTLYLGTLNAAGIMAFAYRSIFAKALVPRHDYRVEAVRHLDESVSEVTLEPLTRPLPFTPGQFVFVTFYGSPLPEEPHPFSMTSGAGERALKLVIKRLGDYTARLKLLEPGTRAKVEGPYGGLSHMRIRNLRQIWIAGGIGITPFLSMARSLDSSGYQVDLFYATETREQAHFLDELYEIADRDPRVRVVSVRKDNLGRISAEDVCGTMRDLVHKDILICGPPAMMDSLRAQFRRLGVPDDRLHAERFSFG